MGPFDGRRSRPRLRKLDIFPNGVGYLSECNLYLRLYVFRKSDDTTQSPPPTERPALRLVCLYGERLAG